MTLSRKIAAAVADHAETGAQPPTLAAADGPFRLEVALGHAGRVGVEAERIDFRADGPELTPDALRDWASRLAARLTYLMEPLVLLEADPDSGAVLLRSQAPTARDGRRAYYELRLDRSGALQLRRIAFDDADRRRRPVPFQLTAEALQRLADDLVASVG